MRPIRAVPTPSIVRNNAEKALLIGAAAPEHQDLVPGWVECHRGRRDGGWRRDGEPLRPSAPVPGPRVLVVGASLQESPTPEASEEHVLMCVWIVGHLCPLSARRRDWCHHFGPCRPIPAPSILRISDFAGDVIETAKQHQIPDRVQGECRLSRVGRRSRRVLLSPVCPTPSPSTRGKTGKHYYFSDRLMIGHQGAECEWSRVSGVLLSPARAVPSPRVFAVNRKGRIQTKAAAHEHRSGATVIGHGRSLTLHRPRALQMTPSAGVKDPRILLVD